MTSDQKKILNGIFCNYPVVNEGICYDAPELNWLFKNKLSEGKNWRGDDNKFKMITTGLTDKDGNYLDKIGKLQYRILKSLSYLKGKGYIDYEKDQYRYRILLTAEGYEIAKRLQTYWGRIDLWYRRNKDGIIWFLLTVLTSAIVTIITSIIIHKVTNL